MQQTGQTGSRQTRHSSCGPQWGDHAGEWSSAERFVSGSALSISATRPTVDVQSVPRLKLLLITPMQEIPFIKERSPPISLDYVGSPSRRVGPKMKTNRNPSTTTTQFDATADNYQYGLSNPSPAKISTSRASIANASASLVSCSQPCACSVPCTSRCA